MKNFDKIKNDIKRFSLEECFIFSILILRGLIPNYTYFSRNESFGNNSTISKIYNLGINFLVNGELNEDLERLENELLVASPNSEDFPSVYSTYALDVASVCYDILSILKSEDHTEATLRTSEISENTSYIFTLESLAKEEYNEEEIYSSKIMVEEIERQLEYLKLSRRGISSELINILNTIPEVSVIGLA